MCDKYFGKWRAVLGGSQVGDKEALWGKMLGGSRFVGEFFSRWGGKSGERRCARVRRVRGRSWWAVG
ncbi:MULTISPECIES: hypothetical protein [Bartonella]|uniref:hypothetical protein n=1 Tax=Bartonella TaxID=773 RepID=UPI0023625F7A|nr:MULTISPECIES: hypothetical protein [Bartonella]